MGPPATVQGLSMEQLHIPAQLSWLPALEQPWSPTAVWTLSGPVALQQVPSSCCMQCALLMRSVRATLVTICRQAQAAMTGADVITAGKVELAVLAVAIACRFLIFTHSMTSDFCICCLE